MWHSSIIAVIVVAGIVMVGCEGESSGHKGGPEPTGAGATTSGSESLYLSSREGGVFFAAQRPTEGPSAMMTALTCGELVVEKGCLRLRHEDGSRGDLPVWPPGWELSIEGREVRVLDGTGRVVVQVGDVVRMGGGQITRAGTGGGYERLRRELGVPEGCPGPIWMVGEWLGRVRQA